MAGDVNYGNVVLLLHCDGTNGSTVFTDSSLLANAPTVTGNASLSTVQSKFGGSSLYFDGAGDYLTYAAAAAFSLGTGDFTIEMWAYIPAFSAQMMFMDGRTGATATPWALQVNATTGILNSYDGTTRTGGTLTAGAWNHVAWTRAGGVNSVWANGVLGHSWTNAASFGGANPIRIGADVSGGSNLLGYLDEIRITKGVARYTANFSVPTAAFLDYAYRVSGTVLDQLGAPAARAVRAYRRGTGALVASTVTDTSYDANYGNVILLLNGLGKAGESTFIDSSTKARLQSSLDGTPVVSSTITKFGNSIYFDGAGDRINYAASADFYLTNTYTIELWMYVLALPGGGNNCRAMMIGNNGSASAFSLNIDPSGAVSIGRPLGGSTGCASAAGVITVGQWKHCAFSVSAGLGTCYINGTRSGTANQPVTSQDGGLVGMSIGYDTVGTVNFNYYGYIDDLRITKGVARYTADFTAPTAPFANRVSSPGLGNYVFDLLTTDELTIVAFDDQVSGTIYNDRVIRVIPA